MTEYTKTIIVTDEALRELHDSVCGRRAADEFTLAEYAEANGINDNLAYRVLTELVDAGKLDARKIPGFGRVNFYRVNVTNGAGTGD